ncbi:MAG: patatin-like phospholipase family protein [Patescibacteria group bacterium]|jgi:NTE family protein
MKNKVKTRKTVGLALGSGGFRGFVHIGVLKSLIKRGIPIDYLSGASIGAWVAAYYAAFHDIKKMEIELAANPADNLPMLFDFSLTGGFIGGDKVNGVLEKSLKHYTFSKLKTPLSIVATDLVSGQPYIFTSGDVARAVRASISVPLVFKPLPHKGKLCVDGGLSNPVPCQLVRDMGADIVIGVNLYHKNEFVDRKFTMPTVILRSTRIALHNLAKADIKLADIVISPDASSIVKEEGFQKYFTKEIVDNLIKIGEQATNRAIPKIKKLLAQ